MSDWTFVSRHALVLASIAKNPDRTAREIGDDASVTERTAHKIILDLEEEGYITKIKIGVKNTYRIHPEINMKTADIAVGKLLRLLGWKGEGKQPSRKAPPKG